MFKLFRKYGVIHVVKNMKAFEKSNTLEIRRISAVYKLMAHKCYHSAYCQCCAIFYALE